MDRVQISNTPQRSHWGWALLGALCTLCVAFATLVAVVNVNVTLAEQSKVPAGGAPYATAFGVVGAAVTLLLAYTTYLVVRGWRTPLFCRALRLTLWVGIASAWLSSVWFIVATDLFNHFGVLGLLLATAGGAFGLKVTRLIGASATH